MRDAVAVLFDWDGTLLNSFPASYRASVAVLSHYGIEVDRKRFLETYSPHWYASYERLGLARDEWDNADRLWRQTYLADRTELFSFSLQLLGRLRDAGFTLGVVTSGDRDRVHRELKAFEVTEFFSTIVCHEDTEEKKPHPAPLEHALDQIDVAAPSTIFVGDRPEDVLMGKRVGAHTVAVESEYGPRAILEDAAPDLLLPDASHLPESLGIG